MQKLPLIFLLYVSARAQSFTFGVKGGVVLGGFFVTRRVMAGVTACSTTFRNPFITR